VARLEGKECKEGRQVMDYFEVAKQIVREQVKAIKEEKVPYYGKKLSSYKTREVQK